jgi:uncharacterized membrane protein
VGIDKLTKKIFRPACYTLLNKEKNKLGENFVFVSLKKVPLIWWNFLMAPAAVHLEKYFWLTDGHFQRPARLAHKKLPC